MSSSRHGHRSRTNGGGSSSPRRTNGQRNGHSTLRVTRAPQATYSLSSGQLIDVEVEDTDFDHNGYVITAYVSQVVQQPDESFAYNFVSYASSSLNGDGEYLPFASLSGIQVPSEGYYCIQINSSTIALDGGLVTVAVTEKHFFQVTQ